MNKLAINVKDQFGSQYEVEATLDDIVVNEAKTHERIKHIVFEGEVLRPNFEMLFESSNTGKVLKIVKS
ncbi:hypothetical protein BEN71_11040 [Acinetobacter wuhouensis]|uniref:Uncharacterized protein n=1 Tax=Acinetobacter wuhouensis TaxID=1879050 RepID=A0A385C5N5_9GAMM|nr:MULTISPECIES: hypothetical protein [Acinetobacter]AXQ22575.1 hypothetical protein BEN71_11040 [Acinetobacter wuhouensis]AYO54206.1 hypothetical protein CDG68_11420 [Acinetobacter wuhouensis]RZG76642.1 hypothetical protein EXE09_06310 [Acinetobacter sp. WCHAc060025]RZG88524.1 hypothetical protein EXE10_01605 [Acinetobacter sp. WCHAc060033]